MTQVYDNTNSRAGKHLTYEERVKIEAYKELGYSNRKIARILKRAPQTINHAINRGTVRTIKQRQVHNNKVYEYDRSEEHTSELQSRGHLVCRLLLEKKKKKIK